MKTYSSESTIFSQLLKLIWESGIIFFFRELQKCVKMHWMSESKFFSRFRRSSSSLKITFFSRHYCVDLKKKKIYIQVNISFPTLKTDLRKWHYFYSGIFKNAFKCTWCRTIKFVQGSGEAQAVWKLPFFKPRLCWFKKKKYKSNSTLYSQL